MSDAEYESEWGWKTAKDDVECEADVLHYPKNRCGDPEATGNEVVSDAIESEGDESVYCKRIKYEWLG